MKLLRPALALAVVVATGLAAPLRAAPIAASSEITAVTVYADRAVVTREAAVDLQAGVQEVLFANLPASLDPDLLQVSGEGTAGAVILDVRAANAQLENAANPRLVQFEEQKRALEAELRALDDKLTVLQQRRDYLERIKLASVTPPQAKAEATVAFPAVAQWEQYLAFYADGLAAVLTQTQDLQRQKEAVEERIDALDREIGELEAPDERAVKHVIVRLDTAAAGSMRLRVSYTVDEARWSPTYDVRVASADKSIVLGYSGMVAQSTGEDWTNVKLVLSTARPSVGGTPPTLATWFLDEVTPAETWEERADAKDLLAYTTASEVSGVQGNFAGVGDRVEADALEESTFAMASVEGGLTSATFTIPSPADIPADNAPHKVSIATHPLEGVINHLAIPKLAELVYLRARVKNGSDFPLIGGPVSMFLDGTFVARSTIETVMPAEEFTLNLGVDDGLSVKRKLLNRLQENTGLVTRKQRITYDVLLTVQNNRQTPEAVVLKDQLPISKHEKITVQLVTPSLRDIRKEDDGTISWDLDLKPGEKREVPLRIAVEYPTDFPVGGLE